jgi:S-adenosylmethionine:tRNA ribosyltransferase-isomerase
VTGGAPIAAAAPARTLEPWAGAGTAGTLDFEVPRALEAGEPPEARGLARAAARLMVSRIADDAIAHARFHDLPGFLAPGDVVVVNASATIPAAIDAERVDLRGESERIRVHFSSPAQGAGVKHWVLELRRRTSHGTAPLLDARPGERLRLAGGARATLIEPFLPPADPLRVRLWLAALTGAADVLAHLARHGEPIRYPYVRDPWPLASYQTMFAAEPGSAEMPSAGRAFTPDVVAVLARRGVRVVPIVLHTGVASLEADEPPCPERYRVPRATAAVINAVKDSGGRVIATGTTVVRALETVADRGGRALAGHGWTDVVVTPQRGLRVVDGIITGFHEPRASHLAMLEALAGRRHLARAYAAALSHGYLWHEFGDLHLVL